MKKSEYLEQLAEHINALGSAVEQIKQMDTETDIDVESEDEYQELLESRDEHEEGSEEWEELNEEMNSYKEEHDEEVCRIKSEWKKIDWYEVYNDQYEIYENLELGDY